jgi:hypothetical protein
MARKPRIEYEGAFYHVITSIGKGSDLKIELLTPIGIFAILCHGEKTPN